MTSPAAVAMDVDSERPTQLLPLAQLLRLSVYWLGLIAVVNGIGVILQERIKTLVPDPNVQYTTLGVIQAAGVIVAVLVQPIAGSVSDYTISRFGRRKPYILIGTLLDVVFLIGIATSNTVLMVGAFVVLLQFSANFAQGPFQGYVPDLIPPAQVGLASGLVGLFTVLGVVVGTGLASIGLSNGDFTIPTIALGFIELVTMLSLFFRLDEGRAAKDRQGKSWTTVAMEAWGRDILQERSFLFLVASRFFILGGGYFLIGLMVPYLERALGIDRPGRARRPALHGHVDRRHLHGHRDHPGREDRRPLWPQAGDLCRLPDRRHRDDDRGARAVGTGLHRWGDPDGRRARQLPGRRLGLDDRGHPQGLIRSVHGDLERRDRDQRRRFGVHRRGRRRPAGQGRGTDPWPAGGVPAGAVVVPDRRTAAAPSRRATSYRRSCRYSHGMNAQR